MKKLSHGLKWFPVVVFVVIDQKHRKVSLNDMEKEVL